MSQKSAGAVRNAPPGLFGSSPPHYPLFFHLFVLYPRKQPRLSWETAHHRPLCLLLWLCHHQSQRTSRSWPKLPSWRCCSGWSSWVSSWNWNLAWPILSYPCSTGCMHACGALRRGRQEREVPTRCSTQVVKPSRAHWLQSTLNVIYCLDPGRGDRLELLGPAAAKDGPYYPWAWIHGFECRTKLKTKLISGTSYLSHFLPLSIQSAAVFSSLNLALWKKSLWVSGNL